VKSREAAAEETPRLPDILPVLPLKDAVLYPYIIVPLSIGRESSIRAVDQALADSRMVLLVAQRDPDVEEPEQADLYPIGTAASIMRMLKLPDGRIRLLVQGVARVRVEHLSRAEEFPQARIVPLLEPATGAEGESSMALQALVRSAKESMDRIVGLGKGVSPEVLVLVANLEEPGRLADLVASNLELTVADAQSILETLDPVERLRRVTEQMQKEIQLLTMQQEISSQARGEIDRSQREYFLRQQLRAIQQELGEENELAEEIARYRKLAEEKGLPDEAKEEMERQIRRLERGHPDGAEAAVQRTYLDWLTGLPWKSASEDHLDLARARAILDEDHYDLEKIKERILEFLAVRKLKGDARGPILCFVGPPGVGKTSLGRSIARAMGRKFVRLSLGGVRDEAEIRGHRRTYVGALPGRILQGLNQAGTSNPVFMLDEIDKLGADFRGDPSSALLEVLDPEQNGTFRDHYLGVAYDLSRVLFVTTANLLDPIQPAFLDRMEVLRLSGYTLEEKLAIARRHLLPKQLAENGLAADHLELPDATLRRIVQEYTREAGLRSFERELAGVCRKVAVKVADAPAATDAAERGRAKARKVPRSRIGPKALERVLGQPRFLAEDRLERDRVGVATGLAWTSVGGELLFVEVLATPGKGLLQLTGQLGDVMKESAHAAMSFARSWASRHGRPMEFFSHNDLHVHVPAGAIPKDGPSAGITIAAAIVSAMTGRKVDRALAMTGEITLRGEVLAIGGLKEKLLAAQAAGLRAVLVPRLNRRDLAEVPESAKQALSITLVETMDEVISRALLPGRVPAPTATATRPDLRVARGASSAPRRRSARRR
jgi:ATP-dependent Lon protease